MEPTCANSKHENDLMPKRIEAIYFEYLFGLRLGVENRFMSLLGFDGDSRLRLVGIGLKLWTRASTSGSPWSSLCEVA